MDYLVALGGNIGDTERVFEEALKLISERVGSVKAKSSWIRTKPLLHPETPVLNQSDYLNGVVVVVSHLSPVEVLEAMFKIEIELGRDRSPDSLRWGPRVIDLDLIGAECIVIDSEKLTLPHPEMHRRRFVLEPLLEVAPGWIHPKLGKSPAELLQRLG